MKAVTEEFQQYRAVAHQGLWSFVIGVGDKEQCDRLVKMFNLAMEYHDAVIPSSEIPEPEGGL